MNTYNELRLAPGQQDLEDWNRQWMLEGDHLHCKFCWSSQWPYDGDLPFLHKGYCPAYSARKQFPWQDLVRIVKHMSVGQVDVPPSSALHWFAILMAMSGVIWVAITAFYAGHLS